MRRLLTAATIILTVLAMVPTSYAAATTPHELVTSSSEKVLKALSKTKPTTTPEAFGATLLSLLEPVVDFDAITDAVISQHRKTVTPEQRARFAQVFRTTMSQLYAKALLRFEIAEINVQPHDDKQPFRGTVHMQVRAKDGSVYKITYNMRQNANGEWRVRNVLLDGINLGLTYRNQFNSAMNRYGADVDKVIDSWSAEMDGTAAVTR
jgi:phospholipid transport system substrate-binding protein